MSHNAEFRNGWPALAVAFLGMGLSVPVIPIYGWGMFMSDMAHDFGWSTARASSGLAVFTVAMAAAGPFIGSAIDRVGAYRVLLVSMPITCLALAAQAFIDGSLILYYALWIVIAVAGIGSNAILWTRLINLTFDRSRGLALGIAASGTAAFLLVVKPVAQHLVEAGGWRLGTVFLSLLPLLTLYPAALVLFRSRPMGANKPQAAAPFETGATLGEAVRSWRFHAMLLVAICIAAAPGIVPHLEQIAAKNGLSPDAAIEITSFMGVALLFGRLVGGYLADKVWVPGLLAAILLVGAASAIGLATNGGSTVTLSACAIGLGFATGSEVELIAYTTARYFGLRSYASIFGIFYGLAVGFVGVWSLAIARASDLTGDHSVALVGMAAVLVVGAAAVCALRKPPSWERRDRPAPEPVAARHAGAQA